MDLKNKSSLKIVGIMSGTSLDGVDFVLTKVNRNLSCEYLKMASAQFSKKMKSQIMKAASHKLNVKELALLHHELGRFYAKELKKIPWSFDAIGLHGQTVFHQGSHGSLQIGEPSYLHVNLKVPVVFNFRSLDIALGGEGAPIASFFHQKVLAQNKNGFIQNIGGIGNLTVIKNGKCERAFDTGPGNMLMDLYTQKHFNKAFDQDGKIAQSGIPYQSLVAKLLNEKHFTKAPPKSFGREEFGEPYLNNIKKWLPKGAKKQDVLATLLELTCQSIVRSIEQFGKNPQAQHLVLCGGGAKNKYLVKRLGFLLPHLTVLTSDDLGWPTSAVEGGAFALLAACKLWQIPSNIPQSTGAKKTISLGQICW